MSETQTEKYHRGKIEGHEGVCGKLPHCKCVYLHR